jgi:hypothetical protein
MIDLTAPCVCGGSPERPNADCERCELVGLIAVLLRETYCWWEPRLGREDAAEEMARTFGLPLADVRRIVGQRG